MFKKILVANRGEIALRVIRACHEMGIETVAIYSEVDRNALHVQLAEEAYCVGSAPAAKSYLNIPNIISVARIAAVDAIHPGYGFLSENAHFAEICQECGFNFIGPRQATILQMGDKATARKTMISAGIPVVPGTESEIKDFDQAVVIAEQIGYPVIIKASSGGGGRGLRIVETPDDLRRLIDTASREAAAAFGNAGVYLEKYLSKPRHIEFQILADDYGNIIHLGERECSIQWRHQKLIEEAPSPALSQDLRAKMGEIAVKVAQTVDYVNAGTVEFLLDEEKNFYFMEMNTRIQVEHPVTELITGIDLVKAQIKIAEGEELALAQEEVNFTGTAIECRLNAEDPEKNFLPSPGTISKYLAPGGLGIRLDSAIYQDYQIPPNYDSMIGKLIAWGTDRQEAIQRMDRALREFQIEGIKTTIPFHLQVLNNQFFQRGEFCTNFIQQRIFNDE